MSRAARADARRAGRGSPRPSLGPRALGVALLLAAACTPAGPRPVAHGEDACHYCRMEVTDARFAAQVITRTGRIHVFDSAECLAGYVAGAEEGTVASAWVTDVERPGTFVAAAEAGYLRESSLRGPMGQVVAFATPEAARRAQATLGGALATWDEIRAAGGH